MSRVGKQSIAIPKEVSINLSGHSIKMEGPKGNLSYSLPPCIYCIFNESDGKLFVEKLHNTGKFSQAIYGLTRSLIANMVIGVFEGFNQRLRINGVGYRAQIDENNLVLSMGYSHLVRLSIPDSLEVKCETPTLVAVSGIEKEVVGKFASKIRSVRPPEPYKGKGISYESETVLRKIGKKGK